MGKKAEVGTPKHLANKMKSKGLQKLRWFCQMCSKQCRDENGFKCHTSSESHQRQLLIFAENPRKFLDEFSGEFAQGFVELLRRRFGTKRVQANQVYQEYISHKEHLHMNATRWLSLTGFVKWLGRTGKAKIEETEKGWFLTYIDRDPETLERQRALLKKDKMDKDDDERLKDFIEKQVEKAKDIGSKDNEFTELKRESEEDKIKLDIKLAEIKPKPSTEVAIMPTPGTSSSVFKTMSKNWSSSKSGISSASSASKRKKSALEEIIEMEEKHKEKKYRKDFWLIEGIVVKVITKKLGDKYYKEKGVVIEIIDKYVGVVKMFETGHKIKLDQEHLETVIPSPGRVVKILNGEYRGLNANLISVDMDKFSTTLEIISGSLIGKILKYIPYEDISKIHQE